MSTSEIQINARKTAAGEPARLLCVARGSNLARRIEHLFRDAPMQTKHESMLGRILDHFEEEHFDVLVLSSSSISSNDERDYIEVLEVLSAESPATQVIMLIYPDEIELGALALEAGSYHYAKLPIADDELKMLIDSALSQCHAASEASLILRKARQPKGFDDLIGTSPGMKEVYRLIRQAAVTDIPILLTGETGTGKDLAAKAIHQLSPRKNQVYTPVHLGALPPELVASELFGHEKGAFTGAMATRQGTFEKSHRGTVFLDEISTIEHRVQISLLRLLETKTFSRIGGNSIINADVRIVAATNENLAAAVARGEFREDLYYRLEVFQINLPPLRDRGDDWRQLAENFLKHYNREYQKRIIGFSPACIDSLEAYPWPGNVRELKNVIQRAVVLCTGNMILTEHLPERIRKEAGTQERIVLPVGTSLAEAEREIIRRSLKATGSNRRRTASLLGISRGTLYNKIKKYNLDE
jgi:DNA-binding NtrC family response regulator